MGCCSILRPVMLLAACGVGLSLAAPAWAQMGTTQIIVHSGDAAADGNGSALTFGSNPALNDAGQIAYLVTFYSGTTGGNADNSSLNLFSGGVHQILSREGDAAPDGNGVQGSFLSGELEGLGSGGAVLFSNAMTGTAGGLADDFGIFQGTIGGVTQIARELSTAPVTTGDWDNFNSTMSVGGSNLYGISGDMVNTPGGTADDNFVARAIGGSASIVTRKGDAIPVGTGTFSTFSTPYTNASGQMVFNAALIGTPGGTSDNSGVFRVNTDGSETQLAREGAAAPGGNGTFSSFSIITPINSSGRAAFRGILANTVGGSADNFGIFTSSSGFVTQIARNGDTAPDGNGVFSGVSNSGLTINDANRVAFTGTLTGTTNGTLDDSGIFAGSGGTLTQIVREGQPVPDGNGEFRSFNSTFSMNNLGIVAVEGFLRNTSGGAGDDNLIVLTDGIDTVTVVRKGDARVGGPITSLEIASSTSTQSSSLNEKGQLAYWVRLSSGQEEISLFTPDVRWRNAGSGFWSSSNNWTLGLTPDPLYNVLIDPDAAMTITGPTVNTAVKSFTLGGAGPAVATLRLNATIDGDLTAANASIITAAGQLLIGNDRSFSAPSLANSGIIRGTGGSGGTGTIDAVFTNQTTGQVRLATGEALTFNRGFNTNAGLIETIGGSVEFVGSLTNSTSTGLITGRDATMRFTGGLTNNGALAVSFGTTDIHGPITNTATGSVVVSGNADVTFYDDLANSGVINVANGSTAVFFGALSGNGVGGTGTVFLEGDTRPGFSPGIMSFGGDVNMGFFSSLTTELGGLTAGSGFDQLAIAGDLSLGGTLNVAGFGGFTLTPGMAFGIITFGGNLTGSFNNIVNSTGLAGLILNVTSDANSVNLLLDALAGDLNLDGFVGIADLNLVLGNWNQNVTAGIWQLGDPTADGFVGIADLNTVLGNWNAGTPPGGPGPGDLSSVPEPGSAAVLVFGGLSVLLRRRAS
jgi:hypothetical protein